MPRLEIDWTPDEGNLAEAANIYYRRKTDEGGGWNVVASYAKGAVYLDAVTTYDPLEIAVAPIVAGIEANEEDWTVTEYKPAETSDFTVPDDVENFSGGENGNLLTFRWDAVTPQPHHYEIRSGSTWNTGVVIQKPPGTATGTSFGWGTTGAQSYVIKAVTAAGLVSVDQELTTVNVQGESYYPVQATNDEHGGGYSGTKSGTEVIGGDLFLEKAPTLAQGWTSTANTYTWFPMFPHLNSGTYVTDADDAGLVVYEKVDVAYTLSQTTSSINANGWSMIVRPAGNVSPDSRTTLDYIHADESLKYGSEILVEIDTTPDDPAGAPTWDGYRPWSADAIYRYRGVRLRITLTSRWFWWYSLTAFSWSRRRQNRKDEQIVTLSSTGGTTVTWATTFTAAPKVNATVISNAARLAVVDTISASTATIYVYDTSGTEQSSGTVHVQAMGV